VKNGLKGHLLLWPITHGYPGWNEEEFHSILESRPFFQTGAFLVAFLGIIFSFLSAIICFLPSAEWHEHDPAMGFASLFFVVLYGAVIYGQKKGKPIFYVPYFILEVIFRLLNVYWVYADFDIPKSEHFPL
jgi:drug/metabolite transporter (DMT)-like permease